MSRIVASGTENQASIKKGVNLLGNAVRCTLGPNGKLVILEGGKNEFDITKDGYRTSWHVWDSDPVANAAINLMRQATTKTNRDAGDGTTTATLLAQELYNHGSEALKTVTNQTEFYKGMDWAVSKVIESLKEQAIPCKHDSEQIAFVAKISTNNDKELGDLISNAMKEVGEDGVITVEESLTDKTYFTKEGGFQMDSGMVIPHFSTDLKKLTSEMTNCYVLLIDGELDRFKQLVEPLSSFLTTTSGQGNLLIIASEIIGDALSTLAVNFKQGSIKCCAVKTAGYKNSHRRWLDDIAVLTGATVISEEEGTSLEKFNLEYLGKCGKVIVSQDTTLFINGIGTGVIPHVEGLKVQLENETNDNVIDQLKKRIARFSGGIGVIYVGALTNAGQREKKDRVDDALCATKAAVEEGYVVGGGKGLLNASKSLDFGSMKEFSGSFKEGVLVVYAALLAPVSQLNNGDNNGAALFLTLPPNDGYNAYTNKIENLIEAGVIDPVKVQRCALENALEATKLLLRTDFTLVHDTQAE